MIDPEFLAMLVCPTTKLPLHEASGDELARANDAIGAGTARNRGGNSVSEALTAGLATEDGCWLYPIQGGIPILLAAEALPIS